MDPEPGGMVGRSYTERGQLVRVLARWSATGPVAAAAVAVVWSVPPKGAPRNVLMERADGSRVVRPFRGLRRTELAGQ